MNAYSIGTKSRLLTQFALWIIVAILGLLLMTQAVYATDDLGGGGAHGGIAGDRTYSVLQRLAVHAHSGQIVYICDTQGIDHPLTATTPCALVSEPQIRLLDSLTLESGDFIRVEFQTGTPNIVELMDLWGVPELLRGTDGAITLYWGIPLLGLDGWMYWGDPHRTPVNPVFILSPIS